MINTYMDFDSLYKSYLAEFTVADAGLAGDAEFAYSSGDTYAPGDARKPKILGATISRKGKVKKRKRKKSLTKIQYTTIYFSPLKEKIKKKLLLT